jgi:translation initiation factor IF-3
MARYPNSRGKDYYKRRNSRNTVRKNERIRAPEIRVIGPDGNQLGVMHPKEALEKAKRLGLDLVEVSATAKPPVCRILDYGKFQYEQSKKQKENKTSSAAQKIKEIKLRVSIDTHDYTTKIRRAEEFLDKGSKLKITLQFRGREMEHKDLGFERVKEAVKDLSNVGVADMDPKLVGRNVSVVMSPLPEQKRRLVHTAKPE